MRGEFLILSPVKSGSSEQFCPQSTIHKPTDRFTLRDNIVQVILETFHILAGIQILTPTLESNGNFLIRTESDVFDSRRSDLHDVCIKNQVCNLSVFRAHLILFCISDQDDLIASFFYLHNPIVLIDRIITTINTFRYNLPGIFHHLDNHIPIDTFALAAIIAHTVSILKVRANQRVSAKLTIGVCRKNNQAEEIRHLVSLRRSIVPPYT